MRLIAAFVMVLISCSPAFSQDDDLAHGVVELRGLGGSLTGDVIQPSFAGGVEAALGLNRVIALTGRYSFGDLGSSDSTFGAFSYHNEGSIHELLAGFRFSALNRTRITPYGSVGVGSVTTTNSFNASGPAPTDNVYNSLSRSRFALALGLGTNYALTRRAGLVFDVQVIGTTGVQAFIRPTGGFYIRF